MGKFITKDFSIAIRYNSRDTDIRTIIASILPKNVCYDESLIVESSNLPYDIKCYMVAILNSFVVDFYIKKLSSRHVTSYILNMLPMPQYNDVERFNLISNTSRYLINKNLNISEHMSLRNKLDALIAHLFNLSYEEFKYILEEFKISNNQRDDMLNHYTKYTYEY